MPTKVSPRMIAIASFASIAIAIRRQWTFATGHSDLWGGRMLLYTSKKTRQGLRTWNKAGSPNTNRSAYVLLRAVYQARPTGFVWREQRTAPLFSVPNSASKFTSVFLSDFNVKSVGKMVRMLQKVSMPKVFLIVTLIKKSPCIIFTDILIHSIYNT